MTALKTDKKIGFFKDRSLIKEFPDFYEKIYKEVHKAVNVFFEKDYNLRLMAITDDNNILFYGDEYFVNKIPIVKNADLVIRISSKLIDCFLEDALGPCENKFELNSLTDIEAMLIKSLTVFISKQLENNFRKNEINKKLLSESKNYNITIFLEKNKRHIGKIIVTFPDYIFPEEEHTKRKERFKLSDFADAKVISNIKIGASRITLNEIKSLEKGDIILLENSDINMMSIKYGDFEYGFKINPDPEMIISVNNSGENNMAEETNVKTSNMWDSIMVDITAEFDNVKLTLGELKQISEGLVIDLGSVYKNKIKLRVENQLVATGELVILNDRYGVRIDNISKNKEASIPAAGKSANKSDVTKEEEIQDDVDETQDAQGDDEENNEDKNFDYSDFEIEDESI